MPPGFIEVRTCAGCGQKRMVVRGFCESCWEWLRRHGYEQ